MNNKDNMIDSEALERFRALESWVEENLRSFDIDKYIDEVFKDHKPASQLILDYQYSLDELGSCGQSYWLISRHFSRADIAQLKQSSAKLFAALQSLAEGGLDGQKFPESPKAKDLLESLGVKEPDITHLAIYGARIMKLVQLGSPTIIINNEKRMLVNALIAGSLEDSDLRRVEEL